MLVGVASSPVFASPTEGLAPFVPPNLLVTRARLDAVQDAIEAGRPLLLEARRQLLSSADQYAAQEPRPLSGALRIPGYYGPGRAVQQRIARRLQNDGRAAFTLSLAHALTGRQQYARAAKRHLFGWVDGGTHPANGGPCHTIRDCEGAERRFAGDTPIVTAYTLPLFCYAYDTLNGSGQISANERARYASWLRPFVHYHSRLEGLNNHYSWQLLFLVVAAHTLEDSALFETAVSAYRRGFRRQISRDGVLWREMVRGRKAATYTLMALEAMTQFVAVAENHGYMGLRGLESRAGGNLRVAVDRLASFVEAPLTAWSDYQWLTRTAKINSPQEPGDWGYFFEIPYAWWGSPRYLTLMTKAPYGIHPERAYTLGAATLLFRPFKESAPH